MEAPVTLGNVHLRRTSGPLGPYETLTCLGVGRTRIDSSSFLWSSVFGCAPRLFSRVLPNSFPNGRYIRLGGAPVFSMLVSVPIFEVARSDGLVEKKKRPEVFRPSACLVPPVFCPCITSIIYSIYIQHLGILLVSTHNPLQCKGLWT